MSQISIHRDLSKLFEERLHKDVMEAISLGELAEIPPQDTINMIMAYLMREVAAGAWSCNMKEETFLKACLLAYRKTNKMLNTINKELKAAQH
jgi:hypothetical protein